jgi:hypothetical protein
MDDATTVKDNFFILSEFFSTLSKEKSENRKKAENTIAVLENDKAPEDTPINISEDTLEPQIIRSDLANLFKNLEHVLLEAKEESVVSTENESEFENIRGLSFDEQTRLNEFSKLMTSFNSSTPSPIKKVEILGVVDTPKEEHKLESFSKEEPEEVESIIGYEDETEEELKETLEVDYIKDVITEIAATKFKNPRQVDVHEKPITDFESLQKEFKNFKQKVIEQLGSIGGGGSVRINDMEDLDTSGREDGDSLIYNSSTNKYTFSSASTPPDFSNQLSLEDSIDGNLLMNGTDSSSTDAGDDFLQESGVNSGRDFEHSVLQSLTSNILPQASGTFDLGSETKRFKNLYLESDTVDIGGATISSDGSGVITISADGATLPVGTKDANDNVLQIGSTTATAAGQAIRLVKFYTQAGGLDTAAATFKFNAGLDNRSVYRAEGHTFLLNDGSTSGDAGTELFQF